MLTGVWRWGSLTQAELVTLIEQSAEVGLTTFDHADLYDDYTCEGIFGRAFAHTSLARTQVQLVSKCGIRLLSKNRPENTFRCYDTRAAYIVASVENSLRELRTDYLDVLLIHRPSPLMHADEMAAAFSLLETQGKVRNFGVSNFTPSQFSLLQSRFPKLMANQIEISPLHLAPFTDGTLDQCQQLGTVPMAWSPLGGGKLLSNSEDERVSRLTAAFQTLSQAHEGASVAQLALAWLRHHPAGIVPILGTTQPARLREAAAALNLKLTNEEWFAVWVASTGVKVP